MEENQDLNPAPTSVRIAIIAAIGKNHELGRNNELLWHLNEDMQFFKETTVDHYVIMGRKSFESIPKKFRPLPNRVNVIISRNPDFMYEECYTCGSLEEAIELAGVNEEPLAFIIGGGEIYRQAIEKNSWMKCFSPWSMRLFMMLILGSQNSITSNGTKN
ncbi:MAG: dihydrofolate reductase [Flavobacteriales bacterium]|nr:dihydrofolate reductase [Flavobacteriales bacterium]